MALRWMLCTMSLAFTASDLASYLQQREEDALMCLYTFDTPDFASRFPACPFGHLVPNQGLVTALGDDEVGYRWTPTDSISTVQIQSSDVAKSRSFYEPALGKRGVTFEMVFRLYKPAESNVNVNLFAIASPYDDCTNPGFRVEISDRHLVVLIFYVLKPDNSVHVCFEQHFYSMMEKRGFKPCQIPFGASPRASNGQSPPIVHVLVSIAPDDPNLGAWTAIFRVAYNEADGTPCECIAYNSMEGARGLADFSKVHGNYKLYIGNNGRQVKYRVGRKVPFTAPPPPPGPTAPPTEVTLLDDMGNLVKMYLHQIGGLFLAFNGKKVVEISTAGISMGDGGRVYGVGDIGRWIKNAFSKLKTSAALQLRKSDILNQLEAMRAGPPTPAPTPQPSVDWSKNPLHARYPIPNASIDMDVFLFAIASKTFLLNRLKDVQTMDLPHMGMGHRKRTITMMQDTSEQLQLWAFTSNRRTHPPLVITQWPEFGTLTRCPSGVPAPRLGAVVNASTLITDACVVYTPPPKLSNKHIPGGNPYLVDRRAALPFSSFGYAVAGTKPSAVVQVFVDSATSTAPASKSKKNQAPGTMTTAILIAPPYEYKLGPQDGGKLKLTLRLHAVRVLHPKALVRVTLKSGMEATVAIPSDPLQNASRAAHCGMQQKFGDVCWARDANSLGVEYELTGIWLSMNHISFRGNWGQVQAALTDLVVTDVVRYAHVTKLKVKIESLTTHLSTFPTVKRTISIQFSPTTSSISLSTGDGRDETDCTPLFFVLPGVCEESFGGRSGIWGSLFTALVVAWVFGMWQERSAAGRAAVLAVRMVQNSSEYNAIVRQFKGVLQEPNMHAVLALVELCETRHETLIALAGVTLVLTEAQTMPMFWSMLLSQPRDHIDPGKLDHMMRWYCRFVGRGWINGVLDAAVNTAQSLRPTRDEQVWDVVAETLTLNLASVPVEIVLLSILGPTPTFGFVDHFLRPSLDAAMPQLPLVVQSAVSSHVDDTTWMLPLAQIVQKQGLEASYTPQTTPLNGGCRELMPHALLHLLCLVKRYEEGMVALCLQQDRDDVPPVGVRLEQIVEALGVTKQMYTDLVQLTRSTSISID